MVNEKLLESELERVQKLLADTDPRDEAYGRVLFALRELEVLLWHREDKYRCAGADTCEKQPEEEKVEETPAEPYVEDSPYPEPKQEESSEELTYESVREELNKARGRGVLLQPIIMKFVPEGSPAKFSSIPAESYPALMEELKNA